MRRGDEAVGQGCGTRRGDEASGRGVGKRSGDETFGQGCGTRRGDDHGLIMTSILKSMETQFLSGVASSHKDYTFVYLSCQHGRRDEGVGPLRGQTNGEEGAGERVRGGVYEQKAKRERHHLASVLGPSPRRRAPCRPRRFFCVVVVVISYFPRVTNRLLVIVNRPEC